MNLPQKHTSCGQGRVMGEDHTWFIWVEKCEILLLAEPKDKAEAVGLK